MSERHISKPIFLLRNLYYMKDRMSRNNRNRKNFKIDSLLNAKMGKIALEHSNLPGLYLNIIFAGYVDHGTNESSSAEIKTYIHLNNNLTTKKKLNKFDHQSLVITSLYVQQINCNVIIIYSSYSRF